MVLYAVGVTYRAAYGAGRTADPAISTTSGSNGQTTYTLHLTIQQAVGAPAAQGVNPPSSTGPHADWLGYQTDTASPHPGTMFDLPRNALVTVIVKNFDSRTNLRNPFFTLVQGTVGNSEYVNGKPIHVMSPDLTSHTFTIPDFGVSVPMEGIPDSGKPPFETMKFTFRTPNRRGVFRWQCIVPCGSGLYGFGGPMSEIGYMQGLITLH
jgi:hypothetical protein